MAPWPLVVLFDEVDVLQDQPMVSFLRQLRSGFAQRGPGRFPTCVALVGMRDLRDYLIKAKDGVPVNPGSPFNIKQASTSLSNFSREDVHALIGQHVAEKGQPFEAAAIDLIYDLTKGQPWLVNAMAQKCVWNLVPEETKAPVTVEHVHQAKELLIQERAVHLDSLAERLKDPRVRRVVQAILVGETDPELAEGDDFRLCLDLGLVTVEQGVPQIANPIYREVIPRVLTQGAQLAIPQPEFAWQKSDGTLDLAGLLREFQRFWRRHADAWEAKSDYPEAFPHLLLMAFLQRVLNGQGRIEREYAAGRGRVDLAVEWQGRWSVIEIKLVHPADGREGTIEEGLRQTARYRDAVGASEAYLVVFDRRPEARTRPWEERLTWEERPAPMGQGGPITVVGA
ncbi:MAG: Cell division protein FtsI [Peptidoglycan synthetase] [Candidatus Ozemobacter sibiricus]|uniref:Cell division protein FtsI [Peptidoglycan synthetase] n=1 Tax=Candidatus Ozemobacter sibiricus TaxID=2268124 RepID=A0A367Z590_9BACT|nr:MAG: Cell division protein FtsI [Peptidoglycan synthetase] [Candidatus Ozemobacter sibiricus]